MGLAFQAALALHRHRQLRLSVPPLQAPPRQPSRPRLPCRSWRSLVSPPTLQRGCFTSTPPLVSLSPYRHTCMRRQWRTCSRCKRSSNNSNSSSTRPARGDLPDFLRFRSSLTCPFTPALIFHVVNTRDLTLLPCCAGATCPLRAHFAAAFDARCDGCFGRRQRALGAFRFMSFHATVSIVCYVYLAVTQKQKLIGTASLRYRTAGGGRG